jgi:hypothetical protein
MTMNVDLTKPLNEHEIKYLVDRCRWADLRTYCVNMGLDEPALPDAKSIRAQDVRMGVNATQLPGAYAALAIAGEGKAEQAAELGGDPTTPVRQPTQFPDNSSTQGANQIPKTDWSKLTVPQLQQELDKRREEAEREDDPDQEVIDNLSYAKDARKDELVAKLDLDDEAIAQAERENAE